MIVLCCEFEFGFARCYGILYKDFSTIFNPFINNLKRFANLKNVKEDKHYIKAVNKRTLIMRYKI